MEKMNLSLKTIEELRSLQNEIQKEITEKEMGAMGIEIMELGEEIASDAEHGEIFFDAKLFREYLANIDKLKKLSLQRYKALHLDDTLEDDLPSM